MHVIIEPPQQVRPGRILNPPIVVRLDKTEAEDESVTDPSLLFAFISITSEDGSTSLAPPRDDLIAGNLSDSVHTLDSDSESDEEEVGFLSFPNLRIQDPGNYRLRVSLMKMEVTDSSASTGAMNLQSTLSRVIHVNSEAEDLSPGKCSWQFLFLFLMQLNFRRGRGCSPGESSAARFEDSADLSLSTSLNKHFSNSVNRVSALTVGS